jgi:acyl-CoA thioesterase
MLIRDTTPVRSGPGRYRLEISDAWSFRDPSGGILMTAALRAAALELADEGLRIRSASTLFASSITSGALAIEVTVLRRGGTAAQLRINLRNAESDGPGMDVLATFARSRTDGPSFLQARPPDVPPPLACELIETDKPIRGQTFVPSIFSRWETRLAYGHNWWRSDWEPGPARVGRWMRYVEPVRLEDGTSDPLALPPMIDWLPPSMIQRLGPNYGPFFCPSLDLTVHFLADTRSDWLLLDAETRFAGDGYASASVHVFDPAGALVAYGTQMWLHRRM